tara:strand:- start:1230 stop:1844 length:615 start_codon:yes stop_codon:yes gene_type:complete
MTFGLVKHNNNSISGITSGGALAQGKMTLLQTQTASSSASIDFTSNIDSTYPVYMFKFINMHPATDGVHFSFQGNASGGSGFNETITSSVFFAQHREDDSSTSLDYRSDDDLAQSTSFQRLSESLGNADDESLSGTLQIFNPSSTVSVKHFLATVNYIHYSSRSYNFYIAGYFNTQNAIDEIQFKMSSGNVDSGTIKLYGIKGS